MINDLATVKKHLRVSSDNEDALILIYMDAAEDWIKNFVDGSVPRFPPEPVDYDPDALDDNGFPFGPYPADRIGKIYSAVMAAQLLLISDLYENREAQHVGVTVQDNPAVNRLLFPYRKKLGV